MHIVSDTPAHNFHVDLCVSVNSTSLFSHLIQWILDHLSNLVEALITCNCKQVMDEGVSCFYPVVLAFTVTDSFPLLDSGAFLNFPLVK